MRFYKQTRRTTVVAIVLMAVAAIFTGIGLAYHAAGPADARFTTVGVAIILFLILGIYHQLRYQIGLDSEYFVLNGLLTRRVHLSHVRRVTLGDLSGLLQTDVSTIRFNLSLDGRDEFIASILDWAESRPDVEVEDFRERSNGRVGASDAI